MDGLSGMRWALVLGLVAWLAAAGSARATVLLPADLGELAAESHAILHGRIVEVRAVWRDGRRGIDSLVTVEADGYFKGDLGEQVTFRVPGGVMGRYRTIILGAPALADGDEVVLFLGARGPSYPYILGLSQGLFRVVTDPRSGRKVVTPPALVARGGDAQPVVRGDAGRRPVPLEEFGALVREVLGARAAGGRE